jgi:hypothetical protein
MRDKNSKTFPTVFMAISVAAAIVLVLAGAIITPLAALAYSSSGGTDKNARMVTGDEELTAPGVEPQTDAKLPTGLGVSVLSLGDQNTPQDELTARGVEPQTDAKLPTGLGVAPIDRNIATLGDRWWNWIASIDTTKVGGNPFDDRTGELCGLGKQQGNLLFLVGTVGEVTNTTSGETLGHTGDVRTCDTPIPRGTSIFFPVVNTECSDIEYLPCAPLPACPPSEHPVAEDLLRACAIDIINHVDKSSLTVKIDGVSADQLIKRAQSGPGGFQLTVVPNNAPGILNLGKPVTKTITTTSVADGYWVLLKATSLRPGKHTITFGGEANFPEFDTTFKTLVTYKIVVK